MQFEPPEDLDVIDQVADLGIDSVGIHVESFDPAVLARVAPAKARTGVERLLRGLGARGRAFGEGQVSTYVILGMGEDPELTVEGCRRAVDMGVYPFVVPLRPVAGSLMADWSPPPRRVHASASTARSRRTCGARLAADGVAAGCARCQACSPVGVLEQTVRLDETGQLGGPHAADPAGRGVVSVIAGVAGRSR